MPVSQVRQEMQKKNQDMANKTILVHERKGGYAKHNHRPGTDEKKGGGRLTTLLRTGGDSAWGRSRPLEARFPGAFSFPTLYFTEAHSPTTTREQNKENQGDRYQDIVSLLMRGVVVPLGSHAWLQGRTSTFLPWLCLLALFLSRFRSMQISSLPRPGSP